MYKFRNAYDQLGDNFNWIQKEKQILLAETKKLREERDGNYKLYIEARTKSWIYRLFHSI